MLQHAIILSFQITAIYMLFQEGMILGWFQIEVANYLDERFGMKKSKFIQKPLWDCLICMSGIWTIALTFSFNPKLILLVCGMNTLIDKLLSHERDIDG